MVSWIVKEVKFTLWLSLQAKYAGSCPMCVTQLAFLHRYKIFSQNVPCRLLNLKVSGMQTDQIWKTLLTVCLCVVHVVT